MNWTNLPAAENQPGHGDRLRQGSNLSRALYPPQQQLGATLDGIPAAGKAPEIRIDKRLPLMTGSSRFTNLEVFTVTLGKETIELSPSKNWIQLDHHKWTARGVLPTEPAGLEVAADHVKILGEIVGITDPAGCAKLERLFNEWLALEKETQELARKKARPQAQSSVQAPSSEPEVQPLRFQVEVDKREQIHIHVVRGKETLASIGLNVAGFSSLQQQGLMRKPRTLMTGALRDWIELDGELFSFEKGRNDAARLEQILNEHYVPPASAGTGKEIVVHPNLASPTGFDIQFPVVVAGTAGTHRQHLAEHSLDLLQDPQHCGLIHPALIIKLIPPNLIFKRKTPDGGEQYLPLGPENTVTVTDEDGRRRSLELHQPLNLLRLSAAELTTVFNHPAVNRHAKAGPPAGPAPGAETQQQRPPTAPPAAAPGPAPVSSPPKQEVVAQAPQAGPPPVRLRQAPPVPETAADRASAPPARVQPRPNAWMQDLLAQPALTSDWFACLVYRKLAEWLGNSNEGKFGPCECWYISLSETEDLADPSFRGIFVTEKGSLGFLSEGFIARFYNQIAFVGRQDSALEGIAVSLIAVGRDAQERLVFILNDGFRTRFGVPEATVASELSELRDQGAVLISVTEALTWPEVIEVVWTVPAEQADPTTPEAIESTRPAA